MRILVTGAGGFIGRWTPPLLAKKGYEVHAVRHPGGPPPSEKSITWHAADLLSHEDIDRLIEDIHPTHLLHFAWIATPGVYQESPDNERWLEASLHLFQTCIDAGCERIVGAGSSFEYRWGPDALKETDPLEPTTAYGKAKRDCGLRLMEMTEETNTSSAWGRVFFPYGPGESPKRLIASVITSLLRGEEARCSDGYQVRDYLYVKDIADAFVALLESPVTGAVNIASGTPQTIRSMVEHIARLLGAEDRVRFGAFTPPPNDPPVILADIRRLRDDVGWEPATNPDEGLKKAIEWWKQNSIHPNK